MALRRLAVIQEHFNSCDKEEQLNSHNALSSSHLSPSSPSPSLSSKSLEGRVAIITGAGSEHGIGRSSAVLFAQNGARLILADFNEDAVIKSAEFVRQTVPGAQVIALRADVSKEKDTEALVQKCLEKWQRLDIIFANAGISSGLSHFHDITEEEWLQCWRVNVMGVFYAIKHASQAMLKLNIAGSIIATASVAGLRSGAGPTDYSASKAAVVNMVQTTAAQLSGTGIRVNAICPGLIETGMTMPLFSEARRRGTSHKIGQISLLKRAGSPHEIASVALFLASDSSSFMTGQSIAVDGGITATLPVSGRLPYLQH